MKFSEVHAHRLSLRVKAKNGDALLHALWPPAKDNQTAAPDVGIPLRAVKSTRIRGEFDLLAKDGFATVVPVHPVDVNPLTDLLASGRSLLARLADFAKNGDGSAELEILDFFGKPLEMGTVEIGIDEKIQKSLRKDDLDAAARLLYGNCVLRHGSETFFFMLAGAAAASDLEPKEAPPADRTDEEEDSPADDVPEEHPTDEEEDGDSEDNPAGQPESGAAIRRKFAIVGEDYRFALEEKDKGNGQTLFLAAHVTRLRNRQEDPALRLARGNLKFVDWTAAGERAILAKIQLDRITESADSYLRKWDEFGEMEGTIFLERARQVGAIPFDVIDESRDGILTLRCAPLSKEQQAALGRLPEVGLVHHDECPEFLTDPAMTFMEFASGVVRNDREDDALGIRSRAKPVSANRETGLILKVEGFNPADGTLRLKAGNAISRELDTIVFPIAGEIAQIKRRMEARKAIQIGRAANPDLGLLIEENGDIPARQAPPKRKALTAFVQKKVFPKNLPTIKQEEAIRVALNTPDIALIQGPPGTGKTTVIAAIVERIHEESDKRGSGSGSVLLTGFQHDAVENLIERLTINGLPVPKFGHRPGEDGDAAAMFSRLERQLREWCDERIAAMEKRNPQIARIEEEETLRASGIQYIKAPTLDLAISLMQQSLQLPDFTLDNDLRRRLQQELAELERLKAERDGDLPEHPALAAVRSLRTRAEGFADDGPDRAADVLAALGGELAPSDRELLEKAKLYPAGTVPSFLDALRDLKGRLLTSCTPVPVYQKEKCRISVCDLVEEAMGCIRKNGLSIRDKKTAALAELLMEMQNNPVGMLDTVRDYSFAFAATCQQSVNRLMQNMKGIQEGSFDKKLEYDYVIVDEAARVGPRDLMIPMAQGKRIILVGDHRQLPHLIDDEIADRMERDDDGGTSETDWLRKSLFEYLFTERLPALEKVDGIKRWVTLDKQFRMHPILGDFVSQNFYDSGERFSSGLPESAFAHDLPGTRGRCAVWLDVPFGQGDMVKTGTSWTRPAERDAICRQLKEWMAHDDRRTDGKRLTFGVIAFYKAQADAISRSLGTSFKDEIVNGRLRIGTVDSFQGREFDVVILSPVRTGRRGFGFLQLYNRLNVAMSRQKKLLAVAGDAAFYGTPVASEKVPGLANFLQLCRDKGVVL